MLFRRFYGPILAKYWLSLPINQNGSEMQLSILPPPSFWLIYGAMVLFVPHKAYRPPVLAGQTEGLLSQTSRWTSVGLAWADWESCGLSSFAGSHRYRAAIVKTNEKEKEGSVMENSTTKQETHSWYMKVYINMQGRRCAVLLRHAAAADN